MIDEIINNNFKLIKDFTAITDIHIDGGGVDGIFRRMHSLTPEFSVVNILYSRDIRIDDNPFGSIEFNSRFGNIELSLYAKNILKTFGYDYNTIYVPSMGALRYFTSTIDRYFSKKWTKLIDTMSSYDYKSPFNISLDENNTNTITKKINKNIDGTDTINKTNNSSTISDNSTNSLYAFGSQGNAVPTDKRDNKYNDTSTENSSNSFTNKTTDSHNESDIRTRLYTRKGNIGNISLSRLTDEERETSRYLIIEEIFKDIADILGNGVWK